jgi:hypothetical protein
LREYDSHDAIQSDRKYFFSRNDGKPIRDPLPSIVPALPPRRQQPNRFQFLIRLPEERNALLALVVLHVVRKALDVGVPKFLARHQIWLALKDNADFFRQYPFWFFLAAH